MTPSLFFLLALSCLLAHEMDAVRRHEWQIFPLLDRITDDGNGYAVFTVLHIPLYALIFWALVPDGATLNLGAVVALDAFCLVHALLHLLFLHHPRSQFNNPFSWALILGAGIAGGIDLLLRM